MVEHAKRFVVVLSIGLLAVLTLGLFWHFGHVNRFTIFAVMLAGAVLANRYIDHACRLVTSHERPRVDDAPYAFAVQTTSQAQLGVSPAWQVAFCMALVVPGSPAPVNSICAQTVLISVFYGGEMAGLKSTGITTAQRADADCV